MVIRMYSIENYKENVRFNNQYNKLHDFLKAYADDGYNEHFHWGRLDWMMSHSYLDVEMLKKMLCFEMKAAKLSVLCYMIRALVTGGISCILSLMRSFCGR